MLDLVSKEEFHLMTKFHNLCVVHFYADWVDQCTHMDKILREMSSLEDYKMVRFIRLPAENVPEVSCKYAINAVPTFIIMSCGIVLERVEGANPSELVNKLKTQINSVKLNRAPIPAEQPLQPPTLELRLKRLINTAPVMLFMKGDAAHPKCGFSRQMIELLDSQKVLYKTFDILADNEVREGLKIHSNWPTYPQLYIYGELMGGLDIVKEMAASGELQEKLPKNHCPQDKLYSLINRHPVMVFMKGNREEPKCNFSKKIMEILDRTKIPFETFDILSDEQVRNDLKKFSNWPTYPQVYVKGELIGGLDVVRELEKAGQLISTLNPPSIEG